MIPQDIIEQLVGIASSYDPIDAMVYQCYGCSKFGGSTVGIDFNRGILDVYNEDTDTVENSYAIKATLEPLDN